MITSQVREETLCAQSEPDHSIDNFWKNLCVVNTDYYLLLFQLDQIRPLFH